VLLENKTAVITGCNRGLGRTILETFALNGADIFACARKDSDSFSELRKTLSKQTGSSIIPIFFDLAESQQVTNAVKEIISKKIQIDILVNNAGVGAGSFFHMTSLNDLKRIFEINFFSQLLLTQGISRYMVRFKAGSIINISSTAGLIGDAGMLSYGSSKAALIFATKTMATELGGDNIRVNAIAPSIIGTGMFQQMERKAREKLIESNVFKRPAEAVEVANLALYLASDLSSFITGQIVRIDGGHGI